LVTKLFAPGVAAAELREEADASLLYPAEAAFCAGFARKRSADFAAGRLCARRALADLGIVDFPIGVNTDRSPRWPPGIAGSISHTEGYCCAVAAEAHVFGSIGIDVEILGRVDSAVAALVFTPAETAFLSTLASAARTRAATIIFSAKEAFYKCQYAIAHQWLDFHDVSVEFASPSGAELVGEAADAAGSFRVAASEDRRTVDGRIVPELSGRFCIDGDLVATGVSVR
jgi:4'-phosphopantetheinyl transferase EntD